MLKPLSWQTQMDFLHSWPELHSLLAAYIAIEEQGELLAVTQFISENPKSLERVEAQIKQLIESDSLVLFEQAAKLSGLSSINQAWLKALLNQFEQERA
jgi:hypothetical protein